MNTNARSLNKKTELLVDNLIELECCLAAMTETWFKDSPASEAGIMDLCDGAGYTSLFRNRGGRRNGGAVAGLAWESMVPVKRIPFHNPGNYEILPVPAKIVGCHKRIIFVACYLPPNVCQDQATEAMQLIIDHIHEGKRPHRDPEIVVTGDFNQFEIDRALRDHLDVKEVKIGPTRGTRSIDRFFSTYKSRVVEKNVIAPLQPDKGSAGADSDHCVTFFKAELNVKAPDICISYQTNKKIYQRERSPLASG